MIIGALCHKALSYRNFVTILYIPNFLSTVHILGIRQLTLPTSNVLDLVTQPIQSELDCQRRRVSSNLVQTRLVSITTSLKRWKPRRLFPSSYTVHPPSLRLLAYNHQLLKHVTAEIMHTCLYCNTTPSFAQEYRLTILCSTWSSFKFISMSTALSFHC